MATNKAALLDRDGEVIGEVFDAPKKTNIVKIAGCFSCCGDPVNVKTYRISRNKKNLAKAAYEQPINKVGDVYTFYAVENNTVMY